jgi:hypothetical protein
MQRLQHACFDRGCLNPMGRLLDIEQLLPFLPFQVQFLGILMMDRLGLINSLNLLGQDPSLQERK